MQTFYDSLYRLALICFGLSALRSISPLVSNCVCVCECLNRGPLDVRRSSQSCPGHNGPLIATRQCPPSARAARVVSIIDSVGANINRSVLFCITVCIVYTHCIYSILPHTLNELLAHSFYAAGYIR